MQKKLDEKISVHLELLVERYPVLQSCKQDILNAYGVLELSLIHI